MTEFDRPLLFGLVLAGGRSLRMGCDKASLVHPDGRTLARRSFDLLSAVCDEVFLSLRTGQDFPAGFENPGEIPVYRDGSESHGPLSGIVAAMDSQPAADWLVVACDLPKLDEPTLTGLLRPVAGNSFFRMYRSESDGKPEPLCGFYEKGARPILKEAMANGNYSIRRILSQNDFMLLEPVSTGALENANTPEDWKTLLT